LSNGSGYQSDRRLFSIHSFLLVALLLPALLTLMAERAAATPCEIATITWDGGAGTSAWGTATNWSGNVLPGPTDHVCIPDQTPDVNVTHSTGTTSILSLEVQDKLTISGGSLSLTDTTQTSLLKDGALSVSSASLGGAGSVDISGVFTWSAGSMSGTGTTAVTSTGTLNVSTGSCAAACPRLQANRVLTNAGTVTVSGSGEFEGFTGSTISNSGTFEFSGAATLADESSTATPDPHFVNTGAIRKTAGTDSDFYFTLENDGTVDNTSTGSTNELNLRGGSAGTISSGTFTGNTILVAGTYGLDGATWSGGSLSGAVLTLSGASTAVPLGSTVGISLNASTINGTATLAVNGTMNWSAGSMSNSGTTAVSSTGVLNVSTGSCSSTCPRLQANRALTNAGTVTMSGSGELEGFAGSSITNSGTFEFNGGAHL
jgi:hypothetical protein